MLLILLFLLEVLRSQSNLFFKGKLRSSRLRRSRRCRKILAVHILVHDARLLQHGTASKHRLISSVKNLFLKIKIISDLILIVDW